MALTHVASLLALVAGAVACAKPSGGPWTEGGDPLGSAVPPPPARPETATNSTSPGPPAENAPLGELRRFVAANADSTAAARLRQAHDRRLLPCPAATVEGCRSAEKLVVFGMLGRAERYLADCLDCRERARVAAIAERLRPIAAHMRVVRAQSDLERATAKGFEAMAQAVADASGDGVDSAWVQRAEHRLRRRARQLGEPPRPLERECYVPGGSAVLVSPEDPRSERPVRFLVTLGAEVADATLRTTDAEGSGARPLPTREVGPLPRAFSAEIAGLAPGSYRVELVTDGTRRLCHRFRVRGGPSAPAAAGTAATGSWTTTREWRREEDDLYGAWLRHLFDAPEPTTWRGLGDVLRDPSRNLLHAHLGLGEDGKDELPSSLLNPDCADAPYFFRAYFAWKRGLPFGWTRGANAEERARGERQGPWTTAASFTAVALARQGGARPKPEDDAGLRAPAATAAPSTPAAPIVALFRTLREDIVARALRGRFGDDSADLYPLVLGRDSLRPGSVYADPHGHTLVLVRWLDASPMAPGKLLAVDAQPDGTIGIKRFWRGTFVYTKQVPGVGHGFKAFRPLVGEGDGTRPLTDAELALAVGYSDASDEQSRLTPQEFYARMRALVNPTPVDPRAEYRALHDALVQQLRGRALAIELAEEYRAVSGGKVIAMPPGRAMFGGTGPWEAYSTPCRDLRLLVGIDALLAFPEELTAPAGDAGGGLALRTELRALHAEWAREVAVTYQGSDGTKHALTLAELIARRTAFEHAYNPNDCPERRWGAPPESAEAHGCAREAPPEQQARMDGVRHWFRERYACG